MKRRTEVINQEWLNGFLDRCEVIQMECETLKKQKGSDLRELELDDAIETIMYMIQDLNNLNQKLFDEFQKKNDIAMIIMMHGQEERT